MTSLFEQNIKKSALNGDAPQFIQTIFDVATHEGASDIHIEPLSDKAIVRLRTDGMLKRIIEYPIAFHSGVVSRIKILSNLKIDEQRIPQDGRMHVSVEKGELDLRVSSLPVLHGEKIVMRIVDKSKNIPSFDELGIDGYNRTALEEALRSPVGIVLTTGPTGSGKTTTLYTCLSKIQKEEINIVTIEDPIEIKIDGLNQTQIKPQIGYTFASGFRSILRQDPDIIMVGEVRDTETLDIAIEASLTGHLVLSTIHTNSAAQTITRMMDMGAKSFLIAATAEAIIAQRLVRKLCPYCKEAYNPSPELFHEIKAALLYVHKKEIEQRLAPEVMKHIQLYRGKGCEYCDFHGYKGRIGLFEILHFTDDIKNMVAKNESAGEIEKKAILGGMIPLFTDGIFKALQGKTTMEEVYRVSRK